MDHLLSTENVSSMATNAPPPRLAKGYTSSCGTVINVCFSMSLKLHAKVPVFPALLTVSREKKKLINGGVRYAYYDAVLRLAAVHLKGIHVSARRLLTKMVA